MVPVGDRGRCIGGPSRVNSYKGKLVVPGSWRWVELLSVGESVDAEAGVEWASVGCAGDEEDDAGDDGDGDGGDPDDEAEDGAGEAVRGADVPFHVCSFGRRRIVCWVRYNTV